MNGPAVLAKKARQELRTFLDRIDDPGPAQRLRDLVVAAARRVGERPLLGRIEPRLARPRYRFWSLPAYSLLIVYDAEEDPVQILRIVHTAQDLPRALKELRS